MKTHCKTCMYWDGDENTYGLHNCQRHAPTVSQIVTTDHNGEGKTYFPCMPSNGWCGDWKSAEAIRKESGEV